MIILLAIGAATTCALNGSPVDNGIFLSNSLFYIFMNFKLL